MTQSETTSAAGATIPADREHVLAVAINMARDGDFTLLDKIRAEISVSTASVTEGGTKDDELLEWVQAPELFGIHEVYGNPHVHYQTKQQGLMRFAEFCRERGREQGRASAAPTAKGGTERPKFSENDLRDLADSKGWYRREGTSVPTLDGGWRHPFTVTADSRDLCDFINEFAAFPSPPAGSAGGGSGDLARSEGTHDNAPVPETPVKPGISPLDTGLRRSGDLGALSAGATPGEWHYRCAKPGRAWIADAPKGRSHSKIILGQEAFYSGDADYAFVAALVSAYRSGRLIEASAPTPDLGAQGEPVALLLRDLRDNLIAEEDSSGPWPEDATGHLLIKRIDRALSSNAAPAAPRPGSGVSNVQIEAASAAYYDGMTGTAEERWPHHTGWAGKSAAFKDKVRAHMGRALNAALFAQAPRDGGETQGGQTQAARDVLAERRRQVEAEGWTVEHDSTHRKGEMAIAAACYSKHAAAPPSVRHQLGRGFPPALWPWEDAWWKPIEGDRRRDLVKAGALILAEIERLDRVTPPSGVETIRQGGSGGA